MKYGKIARSLWHEHWFRTAAGNVRELAMYLLTGPRGIAIPGVTLARPVVVADDLGWSGKRMRPALAALTEPLPLRPDAWVEVDVDAGVMFVPSALMQSGMAVEMNRPGSLNAAVGWVQGLADIPAGSARDRISEVMAVHARLIGGEIGNKIASAIPKPRPRPVDGKAQGNATQIRSEHIQITDPESSRSSSREEKTESPEAEPPPEVLIGGVPVAGAFASQPGMTDLLAKAFQRFGPVHAEHVDDPNLARRRS